MDTDLSQTLGEIQRSLGTIEGQNEGTQRLLHVHDARLNDHTKRISALERFRWYLAGAGAVLVGLGGLALRFL